MMELGVQVAEYQARCKILSGENDLLNKKLDKITKRNHKGEGEESRIQMQLEKKVTKTKVNIAVSHEKKLSS